MHFKVYTHDLHKPPFISIPKRPAADVGNPKADSVDKRTPAVEQPVRRDEESIYHLPEFIVLGEYWDVL